MALDDATRGRFTPSISKIRRVIRDQGTTNPSQWETAVDRMGRHYEVSADQTSSADAVREHLQAGGGVVWAVDYGDLRRAYPARTGSESFDGGHAIFTKGWRNGKTRSFDALLDGRYAGCPKGPVWLDFGGLKRAAWHLRGGHELYALLVFPPADIGGIEPPEAEQTSVSLSDIIADLREIAAEFPAAAAALKREIRALEAIRGPGNPEADDATPVESGVKEV
jgi:hypothetical protein